jgi:CRP-like cAMP-binding protein
MHHIDIVGILFPGAAFAIACCGGTELLAVHPCRTETYMVEYSSGNTLLDSLPASIVQQMRPLLSIEELPGGRVLYPGLALDEARYVYFPISAVTSMAAVLSDGDHVEALPVGFEGLVGFQVIFGSSRIFEQWICSVPGTVARMTVADFWDQLNEHAQLGRALLCYSQALITALAHSVACNAKHAVALRCAKWLLLTHDRVRVDEFAATHDFLAMMLGVRRSSVSIVAADLQRRGLIHYSRGRVVISDRVELERLSCECYATVTHEYDQIMSRSISLQSAMIIR